MPGVLNEFGQDLPAKNSYEHARIMFQIIHFERKNYDYLEYAP